MVYCWSYLDVSALPGGRRTHYTCPVHHDTHTVSSYCCSRDVVDICPGTLSCSDSPPPPGGGSPPAVVTWYGSAYGVYCWSPDHWRGNTRIIRRSRYLETFLLMKLLFKWNGSLSNSAMKIPAHNISTTYYVVRIIHEVIYLIFNLFYLYHCTVCVSCLRNSY